MDLVPSHTSIEHPWFRDDPGRYIWSDRDGPANNWVGVFGDSAWSRDQQSGRWYLHTFFPEQPDLDWRQERVRAAFMDVLRFWVDRGVAGFRSSFGVSRRDGGSVMASAGRVGGVGLGG